MKRRPYLLAVVLAVAFGPLLVLAGALMALVPGDRAQCLCGILLYAALCMPPLVHLVCGALFVQWNWQVAVLYSATAALIWCVVDAVPSKGEAVIVLCEFSVCLAAWGLARGGRALRRRGWI
jgi:hypothetical protein